MRHLPAILALTCLSFAVWGGEQRTEQRPAPTAAESSRERPPEPAAAAEHPIDAAAAYLRELETRLLRLEARMGALDKRMTRLSEWVRDQTGSEPPPGPDPEPTRPPPPEPAPTRPPPPEPPPPTQRLGASWQMTLQDGSQHAGQAVAVAGLLSAKAGPFWLRVGWDDFDGAGTAMAPTPTLVLEHSLPGKVVQLADGDPGTRPIYWQSLTLRVDGMAPIQEGRGLLPPRYALARSALTLDHFRLLPETANLPAWLREQMLEEVARSAACRRGPFTLWKCDGESGDAQAGAGQAIGVFHGGARDWATACAEGRWYRLQEMLGSATRGVWLKTATGEEWLPWTTGNWYWWQASAHTDYALAEYRWLDKSSGWVPWEQDIMDQGVRALDHGSRDYAAAFALTPWVQSARWVGREWALEVMRAYSMDRRVPGTSPATADDDGYAPLWQELERPGLGHVDRREAHAVRIMAEAARAGLLTREERATYLPALARLMLKADDGRGVVDHHCQGDAYDETLRPGSPLECPAWMFFQAALIADALDILADALEADGELALARDCRALAQRIKAWWGPVPPYFATSSGTWRSAMAAPHAGPLGHDYALWTFPGRWRGWDGANYGSFAGLLGRVQQDDDLGECLLDYVPPQDRAWQ